MSEALFKRAMDSVGAIPYRVSGRVRVAYTRGVTDQVIDTMKHAVRTMTDKMGLAEKLPEPDRATKQTWYKAGLVQLDVCDEPCPDGVKLTEVDAAWLVGRATRYHFRLFLRADGSLAHEGLDGWAAKDEQKKDPSGQPFTKHGYLSLIPQWYAEALKRRKADIVAHLSGATTVHCTVSGGTP